MEMLTDWIEVDESKYEGTESTREVRQIVIEVSVSPYDVPQQVRGEYCTKRNRFVIEFRYISDEPTKSVRLDDHATGWVGKNSGRIYSIELDVNALNVDSVHVRVDEAINELAHAVKPKLARKKNYALAKRVLDDYWQPITQLLAAKRSNGSGQALMS